MSNKILPMLAFAAALGVSGAAGAALIDRGGGLIYDDVLDITWLWDANYARTSGYDSDGLMTWQAAVDWATNLSYDDPVRDINWDGWRLPTTPQPDPSCSIQIPSPLVSFGSGCTGSELGHMFYNNMGATARGSILDGANTANLNLFVHIQNFIYWSRTEYAPEPDLAWYFRPDNGLQIMNVKLGEFYAWAVRPGDVGAAVPEPTSIALVGIGLVGLGWARRRRG